MISRRAVRVGCLLALLISFPNLNAQQSLASAIDAYLAPYVATNNFAGQVLVRRAGRTIYEKNFGEADRGKRTPHTRDTRFHVASVSMQFTVAATLRLIDQGK